MEVHPILEAGDRPSRKLWYVIGASGTPPTARVGHATAVVDVEDGNSTIYVIGGANPDGPFNDVYLLTTSLSVCQ